MTPDHRRPERWHEQKSTIVEALRSMARLGSLPRPAAPLPVPSARRAAQRAAEDLCPKTQNIASSGLRAGRSRTWKARGTAFCSTSRASALGQAGAPATAA
jgi:hypothetical protein